MLTADRLAGELGPLSRATVRRARPVQFFFLWPLIEALLPLLLQVLAWWLQKKGDAGIAYLKALAETPQPQFDPAVLGAIGDVIADEARKANK